MSENRLLIAAKIADSLRGVRDEMRRFWADKYEVRTEPFREAIARWSKQSGKPVAEVAIDVIKVAEEKGGGMDAALAIAAACDAMEAVGRG